MQAACNVPLPAPSALVLGVFTGFKRSWTLRTGPIDADKGRLHDKTGPVCHGGWSITTGKTFGVFSAQRTTDFSTRATWRELAMRVTLCGEGVAQGADRVYTFSTRDVAAPKLRPFRPCHFLGVWQS